MKYISYFICALVGLSAFANESKKQLVIVNGGYDETSNHSGHEDDIRSFRDHLFSNKGKIKIFNAGGPGTPVVQIMSDGRFERNSQGFVTPRKSTLENTEKATHHNLKNFFKANSSDGMDSMTVVWGDHGAEDGVALWDGTTIGVKAIRELYKELPKSTTIRAIHLHCFGGMAMVGSGGNIPLDDSAKLLSFLDDKYPSNICGLSLSDSGEVAYTRKWTRNELNKKSLSLEMMKQTIAKDPKSVPTVMLTSDYFLRDVKNTICNEPNETKAQTEGEVCTTCAVQKPFSKATLDLKHFLCRNTERDDEILGEFMTANTLWDELKSMEGHVFKEFMKKNHSDFYKQLLESIEKMDAIQEQMAIESDTLKVNELQAQFEKVRSTFPRRYYTFKEAVLGSREYGIFFRNQVTRKWVKENAKKYPRFASLLANPKNDEYFSEVSVREFKNINSELRIRKSKARAQVVIQLNQNRKNIAAVLFEDPKLAPLKERYENILKCENGPLN